MLKTYLTVSLLSAALFLPAAAHARPDNSCLRYEDRYGATEQTKFGLLFAKNTRDGANLYGCLFSTERPYLLAQQSQGLPARAALNGRYAAYFVVTADDEDAFGFVKGLRVRDLKTGKEVTQAPLLKSVGPSSEPPSPGGALGPLAGQIVGRADGAVAWTAGFASGGNPDGSLRAEWEVLTVPQRGGEAQSVDRGQALDPDSLGKSRGETIFYWLNGGRARSGSLGR